MKNYGALIGDRGTRWVAMVFSGLGLVAAAGHLAGRPSPDVAWNLYMARELLHGAKLGVDLLENSPPMIFALKIPVVAVAPLLGIREWTAWVVAVTAAACVATALTCRLSAKAGVSETGRYVVAAVMSVTLLLLPSGDFGQRDHLMAILVIPYVVLLALRVRGIGVSTRLAILIGALGAVGIGIKPHFVLLPGALTLFLAYRKDLRQSLTPEHLTIGLVGVAYIAGVWVLAPDYFHYAAVYGPLYQDFQTEFRAGALSLSSWVGAALAMAVVPGYTAVGVYVAVRRYLTADEQAVADVLAIATMALVLVGIVQGKGWRYHFLPATTVAALTTCLVVACSVQRSPRFLARLYLGLAAGVMAALVASVGPAELLRLAHPRDNRLDADPNLPLLLPLVEAVAPLGCVAVFSTNISSSFPLVLEGGSHWAFRYPNFWPLVAFYREQVRGTTLVRPRDLAAQGPMERRFTREVLEDLVRTKPELLLVLRPNPTTHGWGGARRFDYLEFFSRVPGFTDWFRGQYRAGSAVGDYDVYWRQGTWVAPPARTSVPGVKLTSKASLTLWTELLSTAAFLVGLAGGWRASRGESPLVGA